MSLPLFFLFLISVAVAEWICRKYSTMFKHLRINELFFHIVKFGFVFIGIFFCLVYLFLLKSDLDTTMSISEIYLSADLIVLLAIYLLFRKKNTLIKSPIIESNPQKVEQELLELEPDSEEMARILRSKLNKTSNYMLVREPLDIDIVMKLFQEGDLLVVDRPEILESEIDFEKYSHPGTYKVIFSNIRLNSRRRINKYLLKCNKTLLPGGLLIVPYQTADQLRRNLKRQLPFLWLFAAFFHEYLPKLHYLNRIYFAITKGQNRWVSMVELWGRLNYCGFGIFHEEQSERGHFLVARKIKTVSPIKKPSYYPVIQLERIALNGRIIRIKKVRTMYPYSEFLQKQVFEQNNLLSTGKIRSDYRITTAGRVFRKYWIDELPQVINWLRSDIKLVGIRAMSRHFFSLYPKEYQELFLQVKPGIISPLFEENAKGFSHIVETEKAYLQSYLRRPILTDIRYFFIVFSQIFFKGVRSK